MSLPITRIILYVKDVPKAATFYQKHFGLKPLLGGTAKWLELSGPDGGCSIALHQAAKSQKSGSAMKVVFGVADVNRFVADAKQAGLNFGAVHKASGFEYANARDPSGNSISVSSRGLCPSK